MHERVDIGGSHRAVIDMIGMLVHIERQDGLASGQGVAVVGRPLIDELAIARGGGEQDPSRAAPKRLSHRNEFRAPPLKGPEVSRNRRAKLLPGRTLLA